LSNRPANAREDGEVTICFIESRHSTRAPSIAAHALLPIFDLPNRVIMVDWLGLFLAGTMSSVEAVLFC
jgi:hypothetical protein